MILVFWILFILMVVSYFASNHMGNQSFVWAGFPWIFAIIEIGILGFKLFGFHFN